MQMSSTAVWEYLQRAKRAGLTYDRTRALSDDALEHLLFPPAPPSNPKRPMPNWPQVHRELGRKHVTLELLWNEYKLHEPDGYGYSWFCKHYERWAASVPVTLRQTLTPGEKLFVAYSGKRFGIVNPDTGEIREAELFVAALLVEANNKKFKKLTGSRRSDTRYTQHTVEIFHRGQRLAAHARSERRGHHTTIRSHRPVNHQVATTEWSAQRLIRWATDIGPHTAAVIQHLLGSRQHPQQTYRRCLGVLNMAKRYGRDRLEAACCRAIELKASNYQFIASTLKNGLESVAVKPSAPQAELPLTHANVRGPSYYH
ncbi:hypothetical protein DFQ28_003719 [Apophysomyces sp. BC1034]|nr:hypothetical protein DFQ28_003719 [Apophysomyces sp. BC1034]